MGGIDIVVNVLGARRRPAGGSPQL